MCFSAAHWARVELVVFGARIADARAAGFHELDISCDRMRELGGSELVVVGDVLRDECRALFRLWRTRQDHRPY
jgi:tRNA(Arg) A34 adenosine deaminase TadA